MGDVEDIEDLSVEADTLRETQASHVRYSVSIKNFKKKPTEGSRSRSKELNSIPVNGQEAVAAAEVQEQEEQEEEVVKPSSVIPGTETIFVKTWGCSHNNSDGEYMAGQLAAFGYAITNEAAEADLWVLNSCTVKNPSEHK